MCVKFGPSFLLFLTVPLIAQSAGGFAGLTGVVRDPSGSVVPNAQVVIAAELGTIRTLNTNKDGAFSAPSLQPGAGYRVTVTATGFSGYEAAALVLHTGENLDLDIRLKASTGTSVGEVTAATPPSLDTKTAVSEVVDSRQISELPNNGRRVDALATLAPGVTNDNYASLLSIRGTAGRNAFLVDGVDTTEQYLDENAGRGRTLTSIPQDAVAEFAVVSANPSAEYGRAMGGVVDIVTTSGSNQFHFGGHDFFRMRAFNARDPFATYNPHERRDNGGANLTGALSKDKVFFSLNVEVLRRRFPLSDRVIDPGVVDTDKQEWVTCGNPTTLAQCNNVHELLKRLFKDVNRSANENMGLLRLDDHSSARDTFSFTANIAKYKSPNGYQTAFVSTTGGGINDNGDYVARVSNGGVHWTRTVSSTLVNQAQLGWAMDRQSATFNQANLNSLGILGVQVAGLDLGAPNYLPFVQPSERRVQFVDNVAWTRGRHEFKFGANISNTSDHTYYMPNKNGYYIYQTATDYALDFSDRQHAASRVGKHWQAYKQTFGTGTVKAAINDFGVYAQDQWRATPKLTVNYGVRYEYSKLPQPKDANKDYAQTGHIHSSAANFEPRVGLAYKLDDKTVLRAGAGMFHARFTGALIDSLFTTNGVTQTAIVLNSTQATQLQAGPQYSNYLTEIPAAGIATTTLQFADPKLKTPYSEQAVVSVERQVGLGVDLTASFISSRGVQLYGVRDLNLPVLGSSTYTYTINNASGGKVGTYTTPIYTGVRPDTRYGAIYQVDNGVTSSYNALTLQARKSFAQGFEGGVAYTWGHEIDDGQGAGSANPYYNNASSWLQNGNYKAERANGALDQRHRTAIWFVWAPTLTTRKGLLARVFMKDWQLSSIASLASGRPQQPTVTLTDTPVTGMFSNTTLSGSGLSTRVPFLPVNAWTTPAMYRADVRLTKAIPIGERMKMYLYFEGYNVTNTVGVTGLLTNAYSEAKGVLTPVAGAGQGNQDRGFPDGTQARRTQVGARFTF